MADESFARNVRIPLSRIAAISVPLSIVALSVVYTIGVLIVNLNLGRYGLVSLNLARPEYVTTGLLWVFLVVSALWTFHAAFVYAHNKYKSKPRFWALSAISGALLIAVPAPLVLLSAVGFNRNNEAPSWLLFEAVGILLLNAAVLYFIRGVMIEQLGSGLLLSLLLGQVGPLKLLNAVPFLLIALSLYSIVVFPEIPREFGGGDRSLVEVFMTDPPHADWKAAGLAFSAEKKAVGPGLLLLETSESIVLAQPASWYDRRWFGACRCKTPVVGIDKKLVSAVIYLPPIDAASAKH